MEVQSQAARDLISNLLEWNKTRVGPQRYRSHFDSILPARHRRKLEPWFTDGHARLIDTLLHDFEKQRPAEYKILMYYFESGQNLTRTAKHFGKRPEAIDTVVNAAIGYLDGQLSMVMALWKRQTNKK